MTMITPSYLGETIEYSSLHACRSTLEDPTKTSLRQSHRACRPRILQRARGRGLLTRNAGIRRANDAANFARQGLREARCDAAQAAPLYIQEAIQRRLRRGEWATGSARPSPPQAFLVGGGPCGTLTIRRRGGISEKPGKSRGRPHSAEARALAPACIELNTSSRQRPQRTALWLVRRGWRYRQRRARELGLD